MPDDQAIHYWAMVKSRLRDAQSAILEGEGLTWDSFKELEQKAIAQMGSQVYVDTEFGRIQRRPKGAVAWTVRRSADVKNEPTEVLTLLNIIKLQ